VEELLEGRLKLDSEVGVVSLMVGRSKKKNKSGNSRTPGVFSDRHISTLLN